MIGYTPFYVRKILQEHSDWMHRESNLQSINS